MNLLSLIGPTTQYSDDQLGGPVQRILNANAALSNAINLANLNSNETRLNRLVAFKQVFEAKAELIFGKGAVDGEPYSEAVQYSLDLFQEVAAAIAIAD